MASASAWCTVNWQLQSQNPRNGWKKPLFYYKLFGRKAKKNGKEYFYDGILAGWKNHRRVKLVDYERHSPGVIAVPEDVGEKLGEILAELKIDHRIIPYDKTTNYLRRTYSPALKI